MPIVHVNGIDIYYESEGSGEPVVLIPSLGADTSCYAFQLPLYSKQFTCYSIDPRGAGLSDKPDDVYTTEIMADDVAAFIDRMGLRKSHVVGLSMGAGVALQLASRYPDKIKTLSLHAAWVKTDSHLALLVNNWKIVAKSLDSVLETLITAVFPLCISPKLYINKPDYIQEIYDFLKSRPPQPVYAFIRQCDAVLTHNCMVGLENIRVPTYLTYGECDLVTSPSIHCEILRNRIKNVEVEIFSGCLHSPMIEETETFNQKSLEFLIKNSG